MNKEECEVPQNMPDSQPIEPAPHAPLTLSSKFMLGLGAILFCVISISSLLAYEHLKRIYINEAYEKTDLVLGHIDATMDYARDELRPQIFHLMPGNIFIRQVMSSSFMNTGIMKRFATRFPNYIYRRVAIDPMNPANKADTFEESFIRLFQNEPAAKHDWRGLVTRNGQEYFLHLKGVVMEDHCLLCHGEPSASPESITLQYGREHGRHWQVGEVVGLESIAVPVTATFRQLRQVAVYFFLFGLAGIAALFAALNYFHYRIAVVPLRRMSAFFKEVVNRHRGLDIQFDARDYYDEASDLAESFNRMLGYLRDAEEERRAMEERVRQADKLASIGRLAAGVAHEINNPLSLILGYTKMLRKECPTTGQTHEDLEVVYDNATICKKIVEDLLNFSRQTKSNLVSVNLNTAIEAVVVSFEETSLRGVIDIVRDYDPDLPDLTVDEEKMRRLFTNLLINAQQAMEKGGEIRIKSEYDRGKHGVRVTITDTGSGIPEEIREKIFEPFFTTKQPGQGTGLGLAVSYGIVKEHGGEILAQNEARGGASFTLWFPLAGDKQ